MNPQVVVLLAAAAVLLPAGPAQPGDAAAGTMTVWSAVYTESQASRGQQLFTENCAQCHGANFRGVPGVPGLVGPAFAANWGDRTLGELLEIMRTRMPPGQAGSLPDQGYADILAGLLQANGFPAGGKELPSDPAALQQIVITEK
jgi:mono/diheme cytochrome c family protein